MLGLAIDLRSIPAPVEETAPSLQVTPAVAARTAGSIAVSVIGMYYLASGKKEGNLEKMLIGAALIIGAMFFF